jgi:pimeloyl-ACP methyl ester carboxylesterase
MPDEPRTETIRVGDYPVRCLVGGDGPPLLFLHGAMTAGVWTAGIAALAARHTVYLPDHPGFGPSPLPDWLAGMDDLVVHYAELLDRAGLRGPLPIAGVSLGGWIAAAIASVYPERASRLVLIDAAGIRLPDLPPPDVFRLPPERLLPLVFHDLAKAAPLLPRQMTTDVIVQLVHDRAALARLAWRSYLHDPRLPRRLGRVRCPSLVVWGREDAFLAPAYAEAWARLLPRARVELIDACGHDPTIEQPEEFARRVLAFLAEEDGR